MKHILNSYFDCVYCTTVYSFHERHELVKKQLANIDFRWILSPPPQIIQFNENLTSSEISTLIGEMTCIWDAKLNGFRRIAIWQDDGILDATEDEMKQFFDAVPENWDCLYMGNADWTDNIWPPVLVSYSSGINKVICGNGNAFTGIQSHVYDELIETNLKLDRAVDLKYHQVFNRGNSYGPSKRYFSHTISMPGPKIRHLVPNLEKYIPSHISHTVLTVPSSKE